MSARPRTDHRITFAVLAAGVGAFALLQSLVLPVLPTVQAQLHTSQNAVAWVLTAYLLSASVFTPIVGRVGDIIGKERMFVAALVALAAGSLLAALAGSIGVMITARAIQGIGGGALPLAFGIVRDEFPEEKITGAIGSLASLLAVGAGLGIVLAGPIVDSLGYAWLFWLPLILTVVSAVAAVLFVPESPVRAPGRVSFLPAILLSAWLVALLVALSQASTWGWASGRVLGLLAAALVFAALWATSERRATSPLIDLRMMSMRAVWTNNLVALLLGVGLYATFAYLPEFVQTPSSAGYGFGAGITRSGLMLLPSSVTTFLMGQYSGRLAIRFGGKLLVLIGCVVGVVAMTMLALAHDHPWEIYVATGVQGVGFGLVFAAMSGLIVAAVPAHQTGVASGMNANIRTIGGSIGAALMVSLITAKVHSDGVPVEGGYTAGFVMLAGAMVLATVVAVLIPDVRPGPLPADEPAHAQLALLAGGTLVGDKSE